MRASFKAYKDCPGGTALFYQGIIKRDESDPINAQAWQCEHRHPFAAWAKKCAETELARWKVCGRLAD